MRPANKYPISSPPDTRRFIGIAVFLTSELGRLPSFSQILYKNFLYFRVWGNYGHTPDTWDGHVIGQRTSQYGQNTTFRFIRKRSLKVVLDVQLNHFLTSGYSDQPQQAREKQPRGGG